MSTTGSEAAIGDAIKVLFVINTLDHGGAEYSLLEMLPGLASAGVDPAICC